MNKPTFYLPIFMVEGKINILAYRVPFPCTRKGDPDKVVKVCITKQKRF